MSKNIYRVNKKSDLDEIMKNNFYKPVCIVFLSKNSNTKVYQEITSAILEMSKHLTYLMIVVIDFDDFIDNNDFFQGIKENVPYFLSFFKGKNIVNCDDKENFIPLIISHMDQIHKSYVNRLIQAFNQEQNQTNQPNQPNQPNQSNQSHSNQSNQQVTSDQGQINQDILNLSQSENQNKKSDENNSNFGLNEEIGSELESIQKSKSKSKSKTKSKPESNQINSKTRKSSKKSEMSIESVENIKSDLKSGSESNSESSSESNSESESSSESSSESNSETNSESGSESRRSIDTDKIRKDKEKLKKIKELQKLKELLKV